MADAYWGSGMKIGQITHYMPPHTGGIECVAEVLYRAYIEHGFQVRWVASRVPRQAPARQGDWIRVPCWNPLEGPLQVPLPLWGPAAIREVAQLAHWADILHVHDCLYPGSVLSVLMGRRLGVPVLLTQHAGLREFGSPALTWVARAAYASLGRLVLRNASRVVFVTPQAERLGAKLLGTGRRPSRTIANGVDLTRFRPATPEEQRSVRSRLGLPQDRPIILFVGRLVEQKGVPLLVELMRHFAGGHFLIIGDGPLASTLPQSPSVTWLASVGSDQIHECYQASDCLVLPAQGEGLPLVVREAAACGLPVLVSDDEGYAAPMLQQQACMAALRTAPSFAGQLSEILSGRMPRLGFHARRYAEAHWDRRSMIEQYISFLGSMQICEAGGGSRKTSSSTPSAAGADQPLNPSCE
jgi:D-inositol-3-phosphate glycosyltransferase